MGKGMKEEDSAANMMVYEMLRTYADRVLMPNYRNNLVMRVLDCCRQEFVSGNHLSAPYIDGLLLGNYHDRRPGAHVKYLYMNNDQANVKDEIRKKLR